MKKSLIILLTIPLLAIGCSKQVEREPESLQEFLGVDEESTKAFEAYKKEMDIVCSSTTIDITARQLAQCKDILDNELIYELFFSEVDKDFSFLPAYCDRKVGEMFANELAECLKTKPEEDED